MLRVDERVLAAAVVGVFVVGAVLGLLVGGLGGGTLAGEGDPTATPGSTDVPETTVPGGTTTGSATVEPTETPKPTDSPVSTSTLTPTVGSTATPTPTLAPTPTETPTVAPTTVATPTETPTRTRILVRRFDLEEVERELRQMLKDWRERQDLEPFGVEDGRLVRDLNAMAESHSVAMADVDELAHEIDGVSSADRYHEYDLYWNCVFDDDDSDYTVTPDDNSLEILASTYAGVAYETTDGTDYNANETAVAEDVFEFWMTNDIARQKLAEQNASRIGIGIEVTEKNKVFVTGNICG